MKTHAILLSVLSVACTVGCDRAPRGRATSTNPATQGEEPGVVIYLDEPPYELSKAIERELLRFFANRTSGTRGQIIDSALRQVAMNRPRIVLGRVQPMADLRSGRLTSCELKGLQTSAHVRRRPQNWDADWWFTITATPDANWVIYAYDREKPLRARVHVTVAIEIHGVTHAQRILFRATTRPVDVDARRDQINEILKPHQISLSQPSNG